MLQTCAVADEPGDAVEAAIAAIDAQRAAIGDAAADLAIAALRQSPVTTPITASVTGQPSGEGGAALRHVTLLFVDVVGSTEAGLALDIDDFHELVDVALVRFTTLVEAANGRVLKYTGDGLLAAFGSHTSDEGDAENAVLAGLGMIDTTRRLRSELPAARTVGFAVRVGVHSGTAIVGGGIEGDRHVSGTAVNLAARMEQSAPVGGLRISNATYQLVRGLFDCIECPATPLKGVVDPVTTYLVIRRAAGPSRRLARGLDGHVVEMVAREDELGRLERELDAVARGGGPRTVVVSADAGVGKTRLLSEFQRMIESRRSSCVVLSSRARPQSVHQPFGVIRDMLAWRVGIADNDPIEHMRATFVAGVGPALATYEDDAGLELLGHMLGFDFSSHPTVAGIVDDAAQVRQRGCRALAAVLRSWSTASDRRSPLVMLLDDLHWSDTGSLEVLSYLADEQHDAAVMLVLAARPEPSTRRPRVLDLVPDAPHIVLEPLSTVDSERFVERLLARLDQVPPELTNALARAEGNPFFMEEIVRLLFDDGVLVSQPDGRWAVVPERLGSVAVPVSLQAVLQSRVDALDVAQRNALQQASVVGYLFWDRALAALGQQSPEALGSLVERQMVAEHAESALADAREYAFGHHLLHQFTYGTVLKHDRIRYHREVARWLDQLGTATGVTLPGLIGEHYELAGEPALAAERFARAAVDAKARGSVAAALAFVERGRSLVGATDASNAATRWELAAVHEDLAFHQSDRLTHRALVDELEALADDLDDDQRRAEAAFRRLSLLFVTADMAGVLASAAGARAAAERVGADVLLARMLNLEATALRQTGRPVEGLAAAAQALDTIRRTTSRGVESVILTAYSVGLTEFGRPDEGRLAALESLRIAEEIGDLYGTADALDVAGYAATALGDLDTARVELTESLRRATDLDWSFLQAAALKNLAIALGAAGDVDASAQAARGAVDIANRTGCRDIEGRALIALGHALGAQRKPEARTVLAEAVALNGEVAAPHCVLEAQAGLAAVELAAGDLGAALERVEPVLAQLDSGMSLNGINEPYRPRRICWEVLAAAGDARAPGVLADAARRLQQQADALDPEVRELFLRLPDHAEIMAAFQSRDVSAGSDPPGTSPSSWAG